MSFRLINVILLPRREKQVICGADDSPILLCSISTYIYIKQLTELFGEISENSSRLQTNARNFKCNFAGGTVYKLNFVSGALESSTRQRLPIIQNLMQTVSTLSKSIYPRPKSGSGLQSDTAPPLAISVSTRPFHHFTALFSLLSPISFLHLLIPSVSRVLYPLLSPPRGNRNLRIHGKSGWGCILYIYVCVWA